MTMFGTWTLMTLLLTAGQSATPQARLTEGRLDADLGDFDAAARAFASVADDDDAPDALRWEALVRLGQVKGYLDLHDSSIAAYRRVMKSYGDDAAAVRFLALAVGGVVPEGRRWDESWRDVALDVVLAPNPTPVIHWPGFDPERRDARGGPAVSLQMERSRVGDVVHALSENADFSFVMYGDAEGELTVSFADAPLERVLLSVSHAVGLDVARDGDVRVIGEPLALERLRTARRVDASGELMSLDFRNGDLGELMRLFADVTGLNIVVLPGVRGSATLKLHEEPWERALFFVLESRELAFTRRDRVVVVSDPGRLEPFVAMESKDYRGEVISVDFRGSGFDDVMRSFTETTGLTVVADARFDGGLHFKLTEVPWDQALDVILALFGLGFEIEESTIRITAADELHSR